MSADLEHIRQIMREADCLYTEAEVEAAIARVGAQITAEMAETNPVVFCVMNGGLIFSGKLLTHLQFPLEASYLHATRYRNETTGGDLFWKAKPEVSFIDRHVLIIDDIQFLANKDRTQEEFFHTFNELYDNGKQIVISSDRTPKELDQLEDRLVSRFEMGMIVDVQFPDYETRLAILHSKCREHEVLIHPEVLEFIAMNVHDSVRELEGVLIQAIAQAQLEHSTPTVRSVAKIIKKLGRTHLEGFDEPSEASQSRSFHPEDVIDLVAQHYRLSQEEILGDSRKSHVLVPRQVAMYLVRHELGASFEQIGTLFGGKNHTTVIHACEKVEKQLRRDKNLLRDVNSIKKEMGL